MDALHHLCRDRRRRLIAAVGLLAAALDFTVGADFRPAAAIGGLCNGRPASSPQLDASGQKGYARLEGTPGDDVIIGGDGSTRISGNGGNDMICAGGGYLSAFQRGGDATVRFGAGGGDFTGIGGNFTVSGGSGRFSVTVISPQTAYLYNGSPDNKGARFVHQGGGSVEMDGGPKGALCIFEGGDELNNCY